MTEDVLKYPRKTSSCISSNSADIENSVRGVIQFATAPNVFAERRTHDRIAYTQMFPVTPVDNINDMEVSGETIFAAGKNLSPNGVGFFHQEPIPSRYVVISLRRSSEESTQYLVKLLWCRFLHPGWYDSGGQIIRMVKWND